MAEGRIALKSNRSWTGEILWKSTQVPGKNISNVEASCYVKRTDNGESYGNNPYTGSIFIGNQVSHFSFPRLTGERLYAGSVWAQVPHDAEGRASVTIRAILYGSDHNDLTGSTLEGSETVALDTLVLAKPSRISLNAESLQMGKKLLISIEADHPDCTHELRYSFLKASGVLGSQVKSSWEWQIPDLAAYCGLSGECVITCRTFLKGQDLGVTEARLTLTLPDPAKARVSDGVLGTAMEVVCERASSHFHLEVSLRMKEKEYPIFKGKKNRFSWTPAYDLAKAQPALTELTGFVCCRTFNGSHLVGTEDTPIRLTVPENEITRPKIEGVELGVFGREEFLKYGYLRGKTGIKSQVKAVSLYSELSEYFLQAGRSRAEGNPAVIEVLEDSGTLQATVCVRDLRGFETSVTREIRVIPYEKPRIIPLKGEKEVIVQRADPSGTLSEKGTALAIRAGVGFTEIAPEGTMLNHCSLSWRYRQGEGQWSDFRDLLPPGGREIHVVLPDVLPSLKHTYTVELRAGDTLGEKSVLSFSILSEAVSFALYDGVDGASFGKHPELPHVVDLAEHMTLLVRGKLDLRGEAWQQLSLAPGISPPAEARGNVEGAVLRLSGGNHVILKFSCRMPGTDLAVNGQPVPAELRPLSKTSALCPCEGGIVLVTLETDGFLRVSPVYGKQDPQWIDGSLEYFR